MKDNRVVELFGIATSSQDTDWEAIVKEQHCPFVDRSCIKTRKSEPNVAIGTCSVNYGRREPKSILICPNRMLGNGKIFFDCLHLLKLHEPGNELHKIPQVEIPGGNVDFFLVSLNKDRIVDFVGIELQTLDTTGTVWPQRQLFLQSVGVSESAGFDASKSFGMNWKMTAKTILVQLHHKIGTFERLGKHLVLVMQDHLHEYMMREFRFGHIAGAKLGHSLHFHSYSFEFQHEDTWKIQLANRHSTDMQGMSVALGLKANPDVGLESLLAKLEQMVCDETLLRF